jgi:hypothetical protein
MKDDKLPDKWCIKVTEENIDTLSDWRVSQRYPCGDRITKVHGYISNTGISERLDKYTGAWFLSVPLSHTEITFEQFKKYVLGMEDKKIIGYKLKDSYRTYMKSANLILGRSFVYPLADSRITSPGDIDRLKEAGVFDLWFEPVYKPEFKVGDWVYGWHSNTGKYVGKAWKIDAISYDYIYVNPEIGYSTYISSIRKATPEEIKAAKNKLPVINGYEGIELSDNRVKYGCKTVFAKTLRELIALGVENIKIEGTPTIYREEIEQILEYFDNK